MKKIFSSLATIVVAAVLFISCTKPNVNEVVLDNVALRQVASFPAPNQLGAGQSFSGQAYLADAPVGKNSDGFATSAIADMVVVQINQGGYFGVPVTARVIGRPSSLANLWETKARGWWDYTGYDSRGYPIGYGSYHYLTPQLFPLSMSWRFDQYYNQWMLVYEISFA